MVDQLTEETFNKRVVEDKEIILVDFWASWCGPCRALAPVLDEVSQDEDFKDKLAFAKVSTEENGSLAASQGVSGIPCMIIYKDGKEVDRIVGFAPKPLLKAKIKDVLAKL